ncbi:hypothetical protein TVAG_476590 [Trichomonas vaginalis G3]|uniref:Uncharacterized protein n=1 Tax=Trichomonas vaginalis (strain ATCC PRA-98 / G3) TaxID=412133 RepID=A2DA82_TRIV3|nr:hypothetical protein TVAGG3_0266630 [Trichomonas vaginalis G3]EAY22730.1 hypothetical protein TVAG_476590 [Trichomonas vaginalis G3]KAI5525541.1 hypothetical protein TVAGG3_0266630 [Trichomonas vaginalis G3]|eukprot:XP_001583716.1 hypothetical protein [Trichomonas vaginalis G3]
MDYELITQILKDLEAPHSEETVALFEKIEAIRNEAKFIKNQPSLQDIKDKINEVREKSAKTQQNIEFLKKKIYSISQILGLIVIKQEKYNHDVFKRRADKYKALRDRVEKIVAENRIKLNEKPKIKQTVPSYKISTHMKEVIQEYIDSKDKLDEKLHEESLFNFSSESNNYALLDCVKDLYYVCKNQYIDVSPFDQTHFISMILGI